MKQFICALTIILLATNFTLAQADTPSEKITTTIEFETSDFDFGTATQGDKINYVYQFTNTGEHPLLITDAKGSCGCTVPEWPKVPIPPGEQGIIEVQFNTKGKSGRQVKRVTITANTEPAQTFLTISGEVIKDADDTAKPTANDRLAKEEKGIRPITEEKVIAPNWEKPNLKDCFAIFPNPTTEVLKLELKEHQGESAIINIFDATGKKMTNRTLNKISADVIEISVNEYPAGTYYVNIVFEDKEIATKCFVRM
ncbi:MAG: DUF1573 domain-containing protein [Bacteroidota bacterium]